MEKFEQSFERIPSKGEVLRVIEEFTKNYTIERELSDEQGMYLLEAKVKDPETVEVTEYLYMRKGKFPNHNESLETGINAIYYDGEMPIGGDRIAFLNTQGEWEVVK